MSSGENAQSVPRHLWIQGVFFLIVINLLSFGWAYYNTAQPYYDSLMRPGWAPPGWLIGPYWFFNNILVIVGNIWAINAKKESKDRTTLLVLQGISWFIYGAFAALAFGTEMPIFLFLLSAAMFLTTVVSLYFAWKLEKRIFWTLVPQTIWLLYAGTVAGFIWWWN